ncbi:MAG: hypothetical protein WCC54_02855 [Pseudolabrys sp.]
MGILKVDERHRSRVCAFLSRREGFHAIRSAVPQGAAVRDLGWRTAADP